jgi:hypothetical protein
MILFSSCDLLRPEEKMSGVLTYVRILHLIYMYFWVDRENLTDPRDQGIIQAFKDPLLQQALGGISVIDLILLPTPLQWLLVFDSSLDQSSKQGLDTIEVTQRMMENLERRPFL